MRSSPSTKLPRTYSAALDGCRPSTSIRRSLTSPSVVVLLTVIGPRPLRARLLLRSPATRAQYDVDAVKWCVRVPAEQPLSKAGSLWKPRESSQQKLFAS